MRDDGRIICVLGADTGVGKTTVTRLLLAHSRARGIGTVALKPFSSGGREDAVALMGGHCEEASLGLINPWHYELPLAPLLAARIGGKATPELGRVIAWIKTHSERSQIVLVEGVGGLLTPIAQTYSFLDVAKALGSTVIVVVRNRLGAISQARMCYETSKQYQSRPGVIVLSGERDEDCSAATNRDAIEEFCPQWPVVEIPYVGETSAGRGFETIAKNCEKLLAQILQVGRNGLVLCEANRKAKRRDGKKGKVREQALVCFKKI